ncbi:hypothetical protein IAT38_004682 [Cryptococcus sp. DSM 104549]
MRVPLTHPVGHSYHPSHTSTPTLSSSSTPLNSPEPSRPPFRPAIALTSREEPAAHFNSAQSPSSSRHLPPGPAEVGSHSSPKLSHPRGASPHSHMAGGFASIHVGLGSPKLEFGRDWPGGSRREKSIGPETAEREKPAHTSESSTSSLSSVRSKEKRGSGLVDRVSGLPSPPGTESDIALPADKSGGVSSSSSATQTRAMMSGSPEKTASPQRPPRSPRRVSTTSSPNLLSSRRTSSHSGSSATRTPDSPRLHANAMKLKGAAASMSRSSSSTSVVTASPILEQRRSEIFGSGGGGSRGSVASDMSRKSSHASSASLGESRGSSPRRKGPPPLDLHSSTSSRASSPEKTAKKLPPVSGSFDKDERRPSRRLSNGLHSEPLEEEDMRERTHTRRRSQGAVLDEKIKEAEEKIVQSSSSRTRRSLDVERATPVRGSIRRQDSYSRAQGSPGPMSSTLRRNATLSSASASAPNGDVPRRRAEGSYEEEDEDMRQGIGERSGGSGSGSSRRRKALPTDFRNGGFFTPSPKTQPNQAPDDAPPSSARSTRLRQVIDSPSQYNSPSPLPSRFSTTSRIGRDYDGGVPSPSRPSTAGRIDGLERSSTIAGMRGGETSGYSRRNWSQSISGLPKAAEPEMLDQRGLPKDRYRPDSVLEGAGDRTRYQARGSAESALTERELSRRGMSMLVNERDLANASARSRITSIAPGDSISAVGAKSDREGSKDPLDVIRRLEEQRAQSKRRWDHMPRPSTSMSSMRDIYQNPPRTAPVESVLPPRRSMDQDTLVSPSYGRGGASRLSLRPMTEPRHKRSYTSLGGQSSASLDQAQPPSTEHGRLLFEAFRGLESKLGQEGLPSPELMGAFGSAARTSETVNSTLGAAFELANQISLEAVVEDDSAKVREGYTALVMLLREAGKASDQNMRDMTRVMLDLPKVLRQGRATQPLTPSSSMRLRRSESLATSSAFDQIRAGGMSDERVRRWQPSAASMYNDQGADRSPYQSCYSVDTPRRSFDVLRASTSIGESYSPSPRPPRERPGSTVSSLVSKVRSMGLTPRKGPLSPKTDLSTIEQSPPQPQVPQVPNNPSLAPATKPRSSLSSSSRSVSPEKPKTNVLKKKPSVASNHTVRGSSFLPQGSRSKATTAVSQVTAGDRSPPMSIRSGRTLEMDDEPNSPMSRFSFQSQREAAHSEDDGEGETDGWGAGGSYQSFEGNAISVLERNLVDAAKAREEGEAGWKGKGKEMEVERERESNVEEGRGKKMTERFKASWRRNSSRPEGGS